MLRSHSAVLAVALAVGLTFPQLALPQSDKTKLPPDPDATRAFEMSVEDGFRVLSVGDVIMSTPVMQLDDPRFVAVLEILDGGDVVFGNFENTAIDLDSFEGYPAPLFGGLRLRQSPESVLDLRRMGFNLMSRANNHTTDWGIEGLQETSRALDEAGIVHSGAGETKGAARAGAFLETPRGRVGVVSTASSFMADSRAMDPVGKMRGRPGLSSLRTTPLYFVTEDELEVLRGIRDSQPEGPVSPAVRVPEEETEGEISLFGRTYKVGDRRGWEYRMNEDDLSEILHSIKGAKRDSDFVIATIHTHEPGNWSDKAPEFLEDFARQSIDAGADLFVGHGPHLLRGIEIYKGKPILYSLANFFFQVELQSPLSEDIFASFDEAPEEMNDGEFLRRWMDHYFEDSIWFESVIAETLYEEGALSEVRLHPVELGHELPGASRGIPRIARPEAAQRILETLQRLSEPYGTEIRIEDGVGVIRVSKR